MVLFRHVFAITNVGYVRHCIYYADRLYMAVCFYVHECVAQCSTDPPVDWNLNSVVIPHNELYCTVDTVCALHL